MKRFHFIFCFIFIIGVDLSYGQDSLAFKPSGRVIARSFFEYSTGLGHVNDQAGFDITRAYLGYNYKLTSTLQAQIVIDGAASKTSGDKNEVYLRNAFVNWKDKGFNINIGQIGLLQYQIQQTYWMHRHVLKTSQDLNKMIPSVDLGIMTQYTFNSYLSVDISITNGEGYKKIKKDNSLRYAAGVSLFPIKNTIFRIYADVYTDTENSRDLPPSYITEVEHGDQQTLSFFAGYRNHIISCGAEYNKVFNKGFTSNKNYSISSFYTTAKVASMWRIFARYDLTDSSKPSTFMESWNDSQDGQLMVIGTEFQPVRQFKVAPNFRNVNLHRGKSEQYFFVNMEFNL